MSNMIKSILVMIAIVSYSIFFIFAISMIISEFQYKRQINQICIEKFETLEEIKNCKTILLKVGEK